MNIDNERIMLQFELPLCEIVVDFHDVLKTISSGYASFDYEDNGYQLSSLVKVMYKATGELNLKNNYFSDAYFIKWGRRGRTKYHSPHESSAEDRKKIMFEAKRNNS